MTNSNENSLTLDWEIMIVSEPKNNTPQNHLKVTDFTVSNQLARIRLTKGTGQVVGQSASILVLFLLIPYEYDE